MTRHAGRIVRVVPILIALGCDVEVVTGPGGGGGGDGGSGADASGGVYNINADMVGNQLAAALRAERLFLVTSTPGVLRDVHDPSSRLTRLTAAEARAAIADGTVTGGMIPKLEEAIAVVAQGVGAIHILGKLGPGDLVRAVREPGSVGTTLVA